MPAIFLLLLFQLLGELTVRLLPVPLSGNDLVAPVHASQKDS